MGEADVPFLEPSMELGQNISYSTEICIAFAFIENNIMELWRNCNETATPAENRYLPPNFCFFSLN